MSLCDDVVDLTDRSASRTGRSTGTVPDGVVGRSCGSDIHRRRRTFRPPAGRVAGCRCSITWMQQGACGAYWKRHVAPMLDRVRPHCGKALKYVETDSWECGGMNWSPGFEKKFGGVSSGYDCIALAAGNSPGSSLQTGDSSNAFLADFRKATRACTSRRTTTGFWTNWRRSTGSGDPAGVGAGLTQGPLDGIKNHGRSDLAMSEFWRPSPHRPRPENRFFVKQAASAAHTYGIKLVGAEGFTSIGPHWNDSFWRHQKPSFDHEACDGAEPDVHPYVHVFAEGDGIAWDKSISPGRISIRTARGGRWPGRSSAIMNRCQWMLQQGRFVADVAYYYGDHVPNIARRKADDPAGRSSGI